jgi:hypothetical protein
MTNDHVFPEDIGTGAPGGDAADAANFGALAQHDLLSDYKATGLSVFNVDYTGLTFDLSAGKAFIKDASALTAQTGQSRDRGVVYEVEVASRSDISLTDASVNEVYLDVDLNNDDSITVNVITDGSTPSTPYLKIAEIDTTNDTVDEGFNDSLDVSGYDLVDGNTLVWDSSAGEVPDSALGSIENTTLQNDSVTVTGGNGIKNGGSVSLGSSITLDVEPADFAGSGLNDDGSDNLELTNDSLTVTAGNALTGGGSVSLGGSTSIDVAQDSIAINEIDLTIQPTWTSEHTFSGGITGLPSPDTDSDAAPKVYVDSVAEGLDVKEEVRVCTCGNGNIDLSSSTDPNPIDGVTLADGDRILLIEQTDATENGIYVANTATDPSTWTRAPDANEDAEVSTGMFTFTIEGTNNANVGFILISDDPITLGTTALNFARFSGAESLNVGDGLSKSGNELFHTDTSSQGDVSANAGGAITDITLDTFGHITSASTTDFDSRFVLESGDTMSGQLILNGGLNMSNNVISNPAGIVAGTGDFNTNIDVGSRWFIQNDSSSDLFEVDDSEKSFGAAFGTQKLTLPTNTSDPTASIGQMWYRSDLD